jgi:hypothetical protein
MIFDPLNRTNEFLETDDISWIRDEIMIIHIFVSYCIIFRVFRSSTMLEISTLDDLFQLSNA